MPNLLLLTICILTGLLLRKTGIVKREASIPLNKIIIYFFIPVLTLKYLPEIEFQSGYWWVIICPWLIYLGAFLFFRGLQRVFGNERETTGVLIMTAGIGSTSFVGFPVFEMLYGQEGLIAGIIMSLAGTVVVFNTVGVFTGFWYVESTPRIKLIFIRMFRFPPFIAFLLALLLNMFNYQHPVIIKYLLDALSQPFNVLVLLTIGIQLELSIDKTIISHLLMGQFYKLILAPLLIFLIFKLMVGEIDLIGKVCILGAAIGSMNAISIIAAQLGLNPKLAIQMPSLSIPLSIPWLLVIDYFLF